MSRIARRLVATLAILVGVLALGTTAASAHATLESSSPADGQSVLTSPSEIRITFNEAVTTISGGLSVLNADGKTVDTGNSEIVGGRTLVAPISETLSDGTYVATYRVLSADGHPVSGSLLFGVGEGALDRSAQPSSSGDRLWEIIGGISRFIMYLAALVAAGVAFFLAFIHDRAEDRWRIVPFVRIGSILAVFSAIGIVMSQAALLTGKGAGAVTDSNVLRDVLSQNLGWSLALLMIGLAAVHLSTDIPKLVVSKSLALSGGLAATVSFAVWGHATELSPKAISLTADAIHATAAALWLGGLVGLVMVLSLRTPETVRATAGIISRFSLMAFWSVIALTIAGLTLTITGSDANLNSILTTTWGQLVLAKIGLTLIVVLIAAWNRRTLVPSLTGPTENNGELAVRWATLLRTIRAEAVLLVAVLALTAIVVNVPPARTAVVAKIDRVDITQRVDTGNVQLSVDPAIVGPNTVSVRYTDGTGQPINVANSMSIEFSQPSAGLEPITRQVQASEPGVFVIQGNELSIPGTWTITIAVRTGDFTEQRTSFEVPVRR